MGGKKSLVQFKDDQKIDIGYFLITQVCSEEEFGHGVNCPISNLLNKKLNC